MFQDDQLLHSFSQLGFDVIGPSRTPQKDNRRNYGAGCSSEQTVLKKLDGPFFLPVTPVKIFLALLHILSLKFSDPLSY